MANERKNFPKAWAEDAGDNADPGSPKTENGWVDEIPDYQNENFNMNKITEMLGHIEVNGIPVWDAVTIYQIGAYSKGSDNKIYQSLQNTNVNHDAISSPSWWAEAFADLTTTQTFTGTKTMNALKLGGNADANDKKMVNLAAPTSNKDGANKAYVDGKRAYIKLHDSKTAGVEGGTFTSGSWQKRTVTEDIDIGNNVSVASSVIVLDAGTYECRITCPGYFVNGHKARLRNTSDSVTILVGTNNGNSASLIKTGESIITGRFTISSSKNLEIQHRCELTSSVSGFGKSLNFGENEIYTVAEFWRIS